MVRYRSSADGFTLLEALVALAILGAVVVVGLEGVGLGAAARVRAADRATLRLLAERKLAELAVLPGPELEALAGVSEGRFEPPFEEAGWSLSVQEAEPGSGLFAFEVEVRAKEGVLRVSGELNRFGELWRQQHAAKGRRIGGQR